MLVKSGLPAPVPPLRHVPGASGRTARAPGGWGQGGWCEACGRVAAHRAGMPPLGARAEGAVLGWDH